MRPTKQTLWCIGLAFLLGLVTLWQSQWLWYWGALISLLAIAVGFDSILGLLRASRLSVERTVSDALSLGAWHKVILKIDNTDGGKEKIDVIDHHPTTFISDAIPTRVLMEKNGAYKITYKIKPTERGQHRFNPVQVRRYSPWSFWTSTLFLGDSLDTKVFPNFSAISKFALRGADSIQSVAATHVQQRRGEGLDFHQLREYRVGDTFRQIDWKATARSQKLISKEFQEERDQQVIFLIDSGRRMLAKDDELSHFDHVLNTVLLLGYVALRQGDAVGYMTCEPDPKWMQPRKGRSTITTLSRNLYDLQPRPVATDFWHAATNLAKRQKRRALIILVTNIRDEDSQELHKALDLLRQRHLVILASLVEDVITKTMDEPVDSFADAINYAATHNYLADRQATHQAISKRGIFVHDTDCASLPGVLTTQYFAVKRAGML